MMTLIALAITVAYAHSAAVTFGLEGSPFFWELATTGRPQRLWRTSLAWIATSLRFCRMRSSRR